MSRLTYQARQRLQSRPLMRLFVLCSLLVLALGMTASLGVAQSPGSSTGSLKEQEDQFIRQYVLPSAPSKPPVYKPLPAPQPKQQGASQPKRESAPQPKPESAAPTQRRFITEPPPRRVPQAPPRRRSEPVQEKSQRTILVLVSQYPQSVSLDQNRDLVLLGKTPRVAVARSIVKMKRLRTS